MTACGTSSDPGGPVVVVQGVRERPCRDAEHANVCVDVTLRHLRGEAVDVTCELILLVPGDDEVAASFGPYDVGRVSGDDTVTTSLTQQVSPAPTDGTWTAGCSHGPEG